MLDFERPYLAGAALIFISALLHFVALVLSGFSGIGLTLGVAGLIYVVFAYGLAKGLRWLAYVAFVVVFIGLSAALSNIYASGPVPGWVFAAIAVADLLAVIVLFIALWRPAPTEVS